MRLRDCSSLISSNTSGIVTYFWEARRRKGRVRKLFLGPAHVATHLCLAVESYGVDDAARINNKRVGYDGGRHAWFGPAATASPIGLVVLGWDGFTQQGVHCWARRGAPDAGSHGAYPSLRGKYTN